jgi:hypothetical protein
MYQVKSNNDKTKPRLFTDKHLEELPEELGAELHVEECVDDGVEAGAHVTER